MVPSARPLRCLVRYLLICATFIGLRLERIVSDCHSFSSLFSEGIEKVEIVQMDNAVVATPEQDKNILDITVTCQGRWMLATIIQNFASWRTMLFIWHTGSSSFSSLPKEVCSVILDSECMKPIHMACNMVEPSKECQLVLRHFFNDSGVYCINVSMANDVSLAATSAKVNVEMGNET